MAKKQPRLYKSRFINPYNENGRTNLLFATGKAGVYIIQEKGSSKPSYIGYSGTNLYKTVLRHFQEWEDKRQVRVSYRRKHDYQVRIIITTPARAEKLERALIIKYQPKDNPDKLRLYSATQGEKDILDEMENAPAKSIADMEDCPF